MASTQPNWYIHCKEQASGPLSSEEKSETPDRSGATGGDGFVGRERELGELRGGLEGATGGRGSIFFVSGEPGIGKTRLARELAAEASAAGALALWGRCWEGGGAPPYWPWVQILRHYAQEAGLDGLRSALGTAGATIARFVPEVGELVAAEPDASQPDDSEEARFRLFDSFSAFLRRASRDRPLLLLFDDLHAADGPSLQLLAFLTRELSSGRLQIVATYRTVEVKPTRHFSKFLADLGGQARHLPLRGLSAPEVGALIANTARLAPAEALVTTVHGATEGNPFFVDEIVKLLLAEGQLRHDRPFSGQLRIPRGVREAIHRRLSPLRESSLGVLSVAAVAGVEFHVAMLQAVSERPGAQVLEALAEALAGGVIVELAMGVGRYRFSHTLFREALYEDLSLAHRLRLHRRIGEALEELTQEDPAPHAAALAHHFSEAATFGPAEKAIRYSRLAGERAAAQLAFDDASAHYQQALAALPYLAEPDERGHCDLLLRLAEAQWNGGAFRASQETYRRAAERARGIGAANELARAALGAGGRDVTFDAGAADPEVLHLLEDSLEALPANELALRAKILARLAAVLTFSADPIRTRTLAADALELARRCGDRGTLAYVLNSVHWATWGPDNLESRLAATAEMIALTQDRPSSGLAVSAQMWRFSHLLEKSDVAAADRELEALATRGKALRQPFALWVVAVARPMRALLEGRFDEVEELAERALAVGRQTNNRAALQTFSAQLLLLRREQGRLAEVIDDVRGLVTQYPTIPAWRFALAWGLAALGREAEARSELEVVAAREFSDFPRDMFWLPALAQIAEVAAELGDGDRAETLYGLLAPYASRSTVVTVAYCGGPVSRSLGLLASVLCRFDHAARHFEHATQEAERMGAAAWKAHAQHGYARMLLARGDAEDGARARALAGEAGATAGRLGMKSLAERLAALEREASVPRTITLPPNVFRAEGQVWRIGFRGRSVLLARTRGLQYLAQLLGAPGNEIHVSDLVQRVTSAPVAESLGPMETGDLGGFSVHSGLGDAGEMLDPRARSEYRRRIAELETELAEADAAGDAARSKDLRDQVQFISRELAAASGLGGRTRKAADTGERMRKAVSIRIREAIAKMSEQHPEAAEHFDESIRTGGFCCYAPKEQFDWALS
jgi:hypothetical protein